MSLDERRSYANLTFKKESLVANVQVKRAQLAALIEELRFVDREQDAWIATFSLHHDVDVDVRRMKVDIEKGIVVIEKG